MPMKEPVHPGRIVRGALEDLDVTVTDAAKALHVSRSALSNLVNCDAGISPEMAYRLSMGIGSTPGFWMRLQLNYDLKPCNASSPRARTTCKASCDRPGPSLIGRLPLTRSLECGKRHWPTLIATSTSSRPT